MATPLITADTSVVVPGLLSWHDFHAAALAALDGVTRLPGHAVVESFAVLTRLPRGRAISAEDAAARLAEEFPGKPLVPSSADYRALLATLGNTRISGGAAYDAVIAASAQRAGAVLRTRDRRALPTYAMLGAEVELVD